MDKIYNFTSIFDLVNEFEYNKQIIESATLVTGEDLENCMDKIKNVTYDISVFLNNLVGLNNTLSSKIANICEEHKLNLNKFNFEFYAELYQFIKDKLHNLNIKKIEWISLFTEIELYANDLIQGIMNKHIFILYNKPMTKEQKEIFLSTAIAGVASGLYHPIEWYCNFQHHLTSMMPYNEIPEFNEKLIETYISFFNQTTCGLYLYDEKSFNEMIFEYYKK